MPYFGHSKFLSVFLYQKGLNKFRMHIFGHSKFIPVFLGKIIGKNWEQPFLAIPEFIPVFLGKIVRKSSELPFLAILYLYQSFGVFCWEKFGTAIFGHSEFFL